MITKEIVGTYSGAFSKTFNVFVFVGLLLSIAAGVFTSCSPRLAQVATDPVFHCGDNAIDTTIYNQMLQAEAETTDIESSIHLMTRWFVVLPSGQWSQDYTQAIDDNMAALNASMEGYIVYHRDSMIWYIDEDLSIRETMDEDVFEKALSDQYGEEGIISVFVLPTDNNLLGYTRLFKSCLDCYEEYAPRYDNIFLSIDAIENKYNYVNGSFEPGEDAGLTVIHEFGHFGFLEHNFTNHKDYMSYHCYRDHFTTAELTRMVTAFIHHRNYLIR